jgi:Ca2+-binding RTX toxin-like protein
MELTPMAFVINSPRFTNEGTIYGGLTMGEGRNYLDTRKGFISGKIEMRGGNDTVLGGNRSENIHGGDGNDKISGNLGNDIITGGAGVDTLTGGAGKDTFIFAADPLAGNRDIIQDFASADDTFKIQQVFFTQIGSKVKLAADALRFGSKAADAEDRIIYHKATGNLYYDPDGTGAEAQVQIAKLSNKAKLVLADFMVV